MVELPVWAVVAQWILLLGLAILVVVLYRQFAYFLELKHRGSPAGGLEIGARAPVFDFKSLRSGTRGRFTPTGAPSLLLFADPGCASCEKAIGVLQDLMAEEPAAPPRVLVATHADDMLLKHTEAFTKTGLEIAVVDRRVAFDLYRTSTTPFCYAIDMEGVIRAKGTVGELREARGLLKAVRVPVEDGEFALAEH